MFGLFSRKDRQPTTSDIIKAHRRHQRRLINELYIHLAAKPAKNNTELVFTDCAGLLQYEGHDGQGGLAGYFISPAADRCYQTPASLAAIGALELADMVRTADDLFAMTLPSVNADRRRLIAPLLAQDDVLTARLAQLDAQITAQADPATRRLYDFIIAHSQDFKD